jgi:hypothetical protein
MNHLNIGCLVHRNEYRMVSCFHRYISLFGGLHGYRKQDRTSTGCTYAEITPSYCDILYDFIGYGDVGDR